LEGSGRMRKFGISGGSKHNKFSADRYPDRLLTL
jgi:hypothetical protein